MSTQIQSEPARSANSFVNTIGTNLHLHQSGIYTTHYDSIIKPKLLELGVRHVRDGAEWYSKWTPYYDRINELGRAGIKFNLITSAKNSTNEIPNFVSKVKDGLESFEGPNEFDINGGSDWVNVLRSYQKDLHKVVKDNPSTANMSIIGPSLARNESYDKLGDLSAFLSYGNIHNYFAGRNPGTAGWGTGGYGSINWSLKGAKTVCGSKAVISTETGYHNAVKSTSGHSSAPESVSGKYIPRIFLEHFNRGIPRTYTYELIDQRTNPSDDQAMFGLLHNNGSPKSAYTAVKNLISLLKDPGPSFSPSSLSYTLSGNTTNVHKTLLQKSNKRFYLVMWLEMSSYDPNTKKEITVPSQQVTLNLKTPISKAITYLSNSSTKGTIREVSQNQLTLNVPDHPLVVELTPR